MISDVKKLGHFVASPVIGQIYFFKYDAKLKDKLPVWDRFPYCIPIDGYPDGWLGLNLHYVSIPNRKTILAKLMEINQNPKCPPKLKANISYGYLKQIAGFNDIKPTIHRYLANHVRSRLVEVDPENWKEALKLPVQQWVRRGHQGIRPY